MLFFCIFLPLFEHSHFYNIFILTSLISLFSSINFFHIPPMHFPQFCHIFFLFTHFPKLIHPSQTFPLIFFSKNIFSHSSYTFLIFSHSVYTHSPSIFYILSHFTITPYTLLLFLILHFTHPSHILLFKYFPPT